MRSGLPRRDQRRPTITDKAQYTRINIYLDDPEIRTQVKIAAAQQGVSMSTYCLEAIKAQLECKPDAADGTRLADDGPATETETPSDAAESLDQIRRFVGPIGVPVSTLIPKGRSR